MQSPVTFIKENFDKSFKFQRKDIKSAPSESVQKFQDFTNELFTQASGGERYLTPYQFAAWLSAVQHQKVSAETATRIMQRLRSRGGIPVTNSKSMAARATAQPSSPQSPPFLHWTCIDFAEYLWSPYLNSASDLSEGVASTQSPHAPLHHYFMQSSHNTYLSKGQLATISTAEAYASAIRQGARCVEIDSWPGKGPGAEPVVNHGFTLSKSVPVVEVLEVIAANAFKYSPWPLIISLEDHCKDFNSTTKLCQHLTRIFGSRLVTWQQVETAGVTATPWTLRGRILIKGFGPFAFEGAGVEPRIPGLPLITELVYIDIVRKSTAMDLVALAGNATPYQVLNCAESSFSRKKIVRKVSGVTSMEGNRSTRPDLPLHRNTQSSYADDEIVGHTLRRLSRRMWIRVYPAGLRVFSSNYSAPQCWLFGAQLVSLNLQSADEHWAATSSMFLANGTSGIVLKPHFLRRRPPDPCCCTTCNPLYTGADAEDARDPFMMSNPPEKPEITSLPPLPSPAFGPHAMHILQSAAAAESFRRQVAPLLPECTCAASKKEKRNGHRCVGCTPSDGLSHSPTLLVELHIIGIRNINANEKLRSTFGATHCVIQAGLFGDVEDVPVKDPLEGKHMSEVVAAQLTGPIDRQATIPQVIPSPKALKDPQETLYRGRSRRGESQMQDSAMLEIPSGSSFAFFNTKMSFIAAHPDLSQLFLRLRRQYTTTSRLVGQRVIPLRIINPGYRCFQLRSKGKAIDTTILAHVSLTPLVSGVALPSGASLASALFTWKTGREIFCNYECQHGDDQDHDFAVEAL